MVTVWNLPSAPTGEMVGRTKERARFDASIRHATAGRGHALLVRGPAGIGKTSLAVDALERSVPSSATVLTARCEQQNAAAPYTAARALFAPLGLAPGSPLLAGSARHALPALAGGEYIASGSYAVQHGLYWLTVTLAGDAPVVLFVDDVQWCDDVSLRWLSFLLRRAEDLPLLVVLTRRTGVTATADEPIVEIEGMRGTEIIEIGPLSLDAVSELVAPHLGDTGELFVRTCAEETGGNPLLLRLLLDELRRAREAGEPSSVSVSEIVGSGRAVLARAVLDRCTPEARATATAIAVLGSGEVPLIGNLAGLPSRAVVAAAGVLRANGILRADGLEFVHDLIRAEVLDAIPAEEVPRLRIRAATLLSDAGVPAEDVAAHLLPLSKIEEPWMAEILREAGRSAAKRGSPGAAARYFTRVLAFDMGNLEVLVELADALALVEPAAAAGLLERALQLADGPQARAPIAVKLSAASVTAGEAGRAMEVLSSVAAELAEETDGKAAAQGIAVESALLGTGLEEKGTVGAAIASARARIAPAGDTAGERHLLAMRALAGALHGESSASVAADARRALRVDQAGLPGSAVLSAALALCLADDSATASIALDRLIGHAQRTGEAWAYCRALSSRALLRHTLGSQVEAGADAHTSFDVVRQELWGGTVVMPQIVLATVLVQRGEPDRADALLDAITHPGLERLAVSHHLFLMTRARTSAARGDLESAVRHARACGESLAECGIGSPVLAPWWLEATCALAALGRGGEGAELAELGAEQAARWGTRRAVGMGLVARGLATGGDRGIEFLTEAARLLDGTAGVEHTRAEYLLGKAFLDRDDPRAARRHFRLAMDESLRGGDRLMLEASRKALITAGGRTRAAHSLLDTLSGSERRVADLAAEGAGNRVIAESLFVTVRTVETHLTNVYRKLEVSGRTELAAVLAGRLVR